MNSFYVLDSRNRLVSSTDFLPADSVVSGDAPKCAKCGKYLGMRPLIGEIFIELELWSDPADDICFGVGDEVLFSSKLKAVFESSQLKGAEFRSVKISKVKSRERRRPLIPSYYLTSIARSRAVIDFIGSGFEWKDKVDCEECHLDGILKRFRKIILSPDTWSGEDIFFARGLPGIIITSQRFYEMIISIGLPKDILIPSEEFSIDFYPWEK